MGSRWTSVDLPLGKSLTYGYDAAGRRTRLVDQDGGWTTWTFDAAGRTTVVLNPFGETTTLVYDAVGRPTGKLLAKAHCAELAVEAPRRKGSPASDRRPGRSIHPCRVVCLSL